MNKVSKQKILASPNNSFPRKKISSTGQNGFTLIEIAIVLVIIGLLLGGVLKGQELINTARVRALNNSVDGITAAWFSFQDRYRGFPGDYSQADINLPGATTAATSNNGNGLVDTDEERGLLWQHLQQAGYITGSFDGVAVAEETYSCKLASCPDNGFGSGMNLSYTNQSKGTSAADAHELLSGSGIPVEVLAELDRKVDDGSPVTGAMRLGKGDASGWTTTKSGVCDRTVGSEEVYDIVTNISSDCAAVFRNF